ncbi:Uma2 family endonuclease [Streptomyces sp. NPDC049954]|uniref:Uma2 family endonuclease n=1 Tax=Streptomyces sp. NPDC049954 TaxID=3155779 RepID=UPI003422E506
MTVVDTDRIAMADSSGPDLDLDTMFELLERMPTPEGYKTEIVEGVIHMSPQRDVHWQIIRRIVRALEDAFGMDAIVLSDVRIDFPGHLNGFAPDVAKIREGAVRSDAGWRYQDVEFVAEVISRGTAANDYGQKKTAYAWAEVPVLLIADPYQRRCHVFSEPKGGVYAAETSLAFGLGVDLGSTPLGLTIDTGAFPVD